MARLAFPRNLVTGCLNDLSPLKAFRYPLTPLPSVVSCRVDDDGTSREESLLYHACSYSPSKPRSGEIKSATEPNNEQSKQPAAAAEAEKPGEMSPQQAEKLLQAMKDEEARVQLDERKPVHRVYNDW